MRGDGGFYTTLSALTEHLKVLYLWVDFTESPEAQDFDDEFEDRGGAASIVDDITVGPKKLICLGDGWRSLRVTVTSVTSIYVWRGGQVPASWSICSRTPNFYLVLLWGTSPVVWVNHTLNHGVRIGARRNNHVLIYFDPI